MTETSPVIRNEYTGNDATTVFAFDFKIFDEEELLVSIADDDGTDVSDSYVLNTDYTITISDDGGGTVTFIAALTADYTLVLTPNLDIVQEQEINNQGGFFPSVVEDGFDRLTIICKQLQEQLDRCVKIDITSTSDPETYLEDAEAAAVAAAASQVSAAALAAQVTADAAAVSEDADDAAAALASTLAALAAAETMGTMTDHLFDGTGAQTAYTLTVTPESETNCWVWIDGVAQHPDTYSVSGTTLTFSVAPASGTDNIYVKVGSSLPLGSLVDSSVTASKLDTTAITGQSAATIAAADSIIFSDATDSGALKKDDVQGILDLVAGDLAGKADTVVVAADKITFYDDSDSSNPKTDTVQGLLDLVLPSNLTEVVVTSTDIISFSDASDSNAIKRDTVDGILDLIAAKIAGFSAGGVGTYMIATKNTSAAVHDFGATIAGSSLDPSSLNANLSATVPSGTWRCMSYAANSTTVSSGALWLRTV